MSFYADLHIHSKWSIATSVDSNLENLALSAAKKGIALLGTGDCTHPSWLFEIEEKLVPAEPGLFRLRLDLERTVLESRGFPPIRFMLQVELSTIYKKQGKTRKVHHLVYLPDIQSAKNLATSLSPYGRLASDGRPTLLIDSRTVLELVLSCSPEAFLIPAHIWTPWFSVLGEQSHFSTIDECYEDLSAHIFAVETGLSSDPLMNWQLSSLDRFQLVSNSDAHSPSKIGRKASRFSTSFSFQAIRHALKSGEGFEGTIEMYPEEGKYYLDGHRRCEFSCSPDETERLERICPCCHKPLTLGVLHRVEELADRKQGEQRPFPKPYTYCVPLVEILSELLRAGPTTKKVQGNYDELLSTFGSEFTILIEIPISALKSTSIPHLDQAIDRLRGGRVVKRPGYDGRYGTIQLLPSS